MGAYEWLQGAVSTVQQAVSNIIPKAPTPQPSQPQQTVTLPAPYIPHQPSGYVAPTVTVERPQTYTPSTSVAASTPQTVSQYAGSAGGAGFTGRFIYDPVASLQQNIQTMGLVEAQVPAAIAAGKIQGLAFEPTKGIISTDTGKWVGLPMQIQLTKDQGEIRGYPGLSTYASKQQIQQEIQSYAKPQLAGADTVTTFMPVGSYKSIAIEKSKIMADPLTGELGVYQKPYGHSQYMLVGGAGRYGLQSGMFSIEKPLTPAVYTQESGGKVLSKYADIAAATKLLESPEKYSRQGAEIYGGYVTPLDARTLTPSAQMSRYESQYNLANITELGSANLSKVQAPGANIPWEISATSPAISTFGGRSITLPGMGVKYVPSTQAMGVEPTVVQKGELLGLPKPFISTAAPTETKPTGAIFGLNIPVISPVLAFFQPGTKEVSGKPYKLPETTTIGTPTVTTKQVGETTITTETTPTTITGGTITPITTISTKSGFDKFQEDLSGRLYSGYGGLFGKGGEETKRALGATTEVISGMTTKAPTPLNVQLAMGAGEFKGAMEKPVESGIMFGVGLATGGLFKGAESIFAAGKRVAVPLLESKGTIGTVSKIASTVTTPVIEQAPKLLGALYAVDIAGRATGGFKEFGAGTVATRAAPLITLEAIPMGVGASIGYSMPGKISTAIKTAEVGYKSALLKGIGEPTIPGATKEIAGKRVSGIAEPSTTGRLDYYIKQPVAEAYKTATKPYEFAKLEYSAFKQERPDLPKITTLYRGETSGVVGGITPKQTTETGRWFTEDPAYASIYGSKIYSVDVPTAGLGKYFVRERPLLAGKTVTSEYVLPETLAATKIRYRGDVDVLGESMYKKVQSPLSSYLKYKAESAYRTGIEIPAKSFVQESRASILAAKQQAIPTAKGVAAKILEGANRTPEPELMRTYRPFVGIEEVAYPKPSPKQPKTVLETSKQYYPYEGIEKVAYPPGGGLKISAKAFLQEHKPSIEFEGAPRYVYSLKFGKPQVLSVGDISGAAPNGGVITAKPPSPPTSGFERIKGTKVVGGRTVSALTAEKPIRSVVSKGRIKPEERVSPESTGFASRKMQYFGEPSAKMKPMGKVEGGVKGKQAAGQIQIMKEELPTVKGAEERVRAGAAYPMFAPQFISAMPTTPLSISIPSISAGAVSKQREQQRAVEVVEPSLEFAQTLGRRAGTTAIPYVAEAQKIRPAIGTILERSISGISEVQQKQKERTAQLEMQRVSATPRQRYEEIVKSTTEPRYRRDILPRYDTTTIREPRTTTEPKMEQRTRTEPKTTTTTIPKTTTIERPTTKMPPTTIITGFPSFPSGGTPSPLMRKGPGRKYVETLGFEFSKRKSPFAKKKRK
jgi:CBS domain-containing protein